MIMNFVEDTVLFRGKNDKGDLIELVKIGTDGDFVVRVNGFFFDEIFNEYATSISTAIARFAQEFIVSTK